MIDTVTSKVRERFIGHLLFGKISLNPKDQAFLQLFTVGFLHLNVVIFLEKVYCSSSTLSNVPSHLAISVPAVNFSTKLFFCCNILLQSCQQLCFGFSVSRGISGLAASFL